MKFLVTYFSATVSLGLGLIFGMIGAPLVFLVLLVPLAFIMTLVLTNLQVSMEIQDEINRQRAMAVFQYRTTGIAKKVMYKVVKEI
jgi:hypothetical protein